MSNADQNAQLRARIVELEEEVREREADLKRFRDELGFANEKLTALIERFQSELKLAHLIQKFLVPTEFPHISGFEFSTKFVPSAVKGGDYFDIFEHEDRFRFGVIVSSASGHAMSALLLSVLLKMTTQLEAKKGSEPHQVLREMLQQLKDNLSSDDAADLFYALVDRRNFEMRFVCCGDLVALHQNAATGEVRMLRMNLGRLSMDLNAPSQSETLLLNPRDRLVLCTPGVIEAQNPAGEAYGLERVTRSFLSGPKRGVHELRNHILFEVQEFTASAAPARDRTVVVVEVKDKVIKLASS